MQALTALLRGSGSAQHAQLVRAFGSIVPAVAEGNPFLRFSNPYPKSIDHSPLLATLPETQVPQQTLNRSRSALGAPSEPLKSCIAGDHAAQRVACGH